MPAVLLVRHAQASFAGPDYDVLSEPGRRQAEILAQRLARLPAVDRVVHGGMRRQADTAEVCLRALPGGVDRCEEHRWDEYDHEDLLACSLAADADRETFDAAMASATDPRHVFQDALDAALVRWTSGRHDRDYRESFTQFTGRVREAFTELMGALQPSEAAVVVTSGGVISAVCAHLLDLDPSRWAQLNRIMVNTGVTKVVHGRRGTNLLAVNDHAHVEGAHRSLLTYR